MRQEIKYTLLACAAVVTLLFIVSAGSLYPTLYLGPQDSEGVMDMFREDLRSQGWTLRLSLIIAGCAWGLPVAFYYIINSVHFDRWWNWLIVAAIATLLSARCSISFLNSSMEHFQPGLSSIYAPLTEALAGWIALFTLILFATASFGMRWWSSNCRHTPFPQ